jgi:hypothetical protein
MWVNIDACPVLQVPAEEQNISVVNLVQSEHVVGVMSFLPCVLIF